ncbi:MAG TPA: DUF1127 domain-containing protein [Xanthobacteraceae bacterium]|nr:DUF1127 domain-containing protein [Xanthobacteraceae bacterium]
MLTEESDLPRRSIGELTPAEWEELRRRAIQRAHRLRSQIAADFLRKFLRALGEGVLVAADSTVAAFGRWHTRRQDRAAIASLHALDDSALRDIGIRRLEIESIVHARGKDTTRARNDEQLAA